MTRIPAGRPRRFISPVASITQAPGRGWASASWAGCHAEAGSAASWSTRSWVRPNPTEYDNCLLWIQSSSSWVAPAPSTRIKTFRPVRRPARYEGSCRNAARMTVRWSAAVFEPAFPGRSNAANGSPVLSGP